MCPVFVPRPVPPSLFYNKFLEEIERAPSRTLPVTFSYIRIFSETDQRVITSSRNTGAQTLRAGARNTHSYIKESDLYLSVSCRHTRSVIRTHTYCGASQEPAERGHEGKAGRRKPGSPQASPRGQAGGENVRAHQRAPLHVGRRLGRRTKQNTPLGAVAPIHQGCTRQRRRLH